MFLYSGGRRSGVSLEKILMFITSVDEEPVLGFELNPSIQFIESSHGFIPTAMTCINQLKLPRGSSTIDLPSQEKLFSCYDYAFCNSYFGLM